MIAASLRLPITAVGSLADDVAADLGLTNLSTALLPALPLIVFGTVGTVGAALMRIVGAGHALILAAFFIAAGSLLRVVGGAATLFVGTIAACAGIAVVNVILPVVVKGNFPNRIGTVTGLYSASLAIGAAAGAALTVPVAEATGTWRWALLVWAGPAVVAAAVWLPQRTRTSVRDNSGLLPAVARNPRLWSLTCLFATQSCSAYVVMGWLPAIYQDAGFTAHEAGLYTGVAVATGAPVYYLVPYLAARSGDQRWLAALLTGSVTTALVGLWFWPGSGALLWAVLLGIGGGIFPLTLVLFALHARTPDEAASISATAQGLGYLIAAAALFSVGAVRAASPNWSAAFVVLLVICGAQFVAGHLASGARNPLNKF